MAAFRSSIVLLALVALSVAGALAQSIAGAKAQKVAEFGNERGEVEKAYLDALWEALKKEPAARAYLIADGDRRVLPGQLLRTVYGYRDYLVNTRSIESSRIEVIANCSMDAISNEFWVVPNGADAPRTCLDSKILPKSPLKFDVAYPDCEPELAMYLYELKDSVSFYAQALQDNSAAQARIVVYPGRRSTLRKAARMAEDVKAILVKSHNIERDRIITRVRRTRRECSQVEFWIVPASSFLPQTTHNKALQLTAR